ncbi:DMT family transporter [Aestuariivirga sp.]|uniref:DMT family transporter n=1 Tax=Aestuariivirga sp. TaxID=2650926 RepID=UPI0035B3C3BD
MKHGASTEGNRLASGILIVLFSTIIWATAGLFVRLLPFDIWSIIVWRNCFAVVFVGGYVFWRLGRESLTAVRNLGWPGWFVTGCSTLTIIAFPAAFQHASVGNVVTIYASLPFVTAALEWLLYRARPSLPTMIAGAMALVGIAIMVGPSTSGPQLGDWLSLLSTVSMAFLTLTIRRHTHINMLPVALLSIFFSGFIAWPFAQHLGDFGTRDFVVAAGFALFPLTLGLMLYVIGSAMVPATLSALISTLEAPFGVLWAWLGVGEVPTWPTVVGGVLVLSGVFGRLLYESTWRNKASPQDP